MNEAIIHLSAGQGPQECVWVVEQLARAFLVEAATNELVCEAVNIDMPQTGSLYLRVAGERATEFVMARVGTIQWIGTSLYRPHHKRRNWFVGVTEIDEIAEAAQLRDADIHYEMMRASGPGGQHVNKTDSAVRATHVPTGLVTTAQEQRSQQANRKLARMKLALMMREAENKTAGARRKSDWTHNQNVERGNAVRIYSGPRFKLKLAR